MRSLGVSIHDRPRAGWLAEDSPLDLLMIRYNAAHTGAEKDMKKAMANFHGAMVPLPGLALDPATHTASLSLSWRL